MALLSDRGAVLRKYLDAHPTLRARLEPDDSISLIAPDGSTTNVPPGSTFPE